MSEAKVRGTVHVVEETKTYGQKGFQKRLVVLEQDDGRFTNYIPLEFVRDSCQQADDLSVGDEIEAKYRLNGREWQKDPQSDVKYFLSAEVINFRVVGRSDEGKDVADEAQAAADEAWSEEVSDDPDDAPF